MWGYYVVCICVWYIERYGWSVWYVMCVVYICVCGVYTGEGVCICGLYIVMGGVCVVYGTCGSRVYVWCVYGVMHACVYLCRVFMCVCEYAYVWMVYVVCDMRCV